MSGDTVLQKKVFAILLSAALVFLGIFSLLSIERLQGNARVINYAGVVRGATQRLVKKELQGVPDDALILRLDRTIEELITGEGDLGLVRLNDEEFQSLMGQMKESWQVIKAEIMQVRQGADEEQLFELSEEYFELADRTVTEAEIYTEKNAQKVETSFLVFTIIFVIILGLLAWFSAVQNRRQKAIQKAEEENIKKSEHLTRMAEELQVPINEISELIYVSDMENYDLLFVNEAGKRNFGIDDVNGLKCYRALQGREDPCPYCTNHLLKPGENYSWETTNPLTKRHYMLKDRVIEWEGRKARIEIAFDMTRIEEEKQKLKYALDTENMVMECIRTLYQGTDLENDIYKALESVGEYLGGERTYIFTIKDDYVYNDMEWCAPGVEPQREKLQGMPLSIFARWIPVFNRQECLIIEDLEEIRESSPEEYEALAEQGIRSLVVAPMENDGVLVGCLGVDNPPVDKLGNIGSLLQALCYFILLSYRRAENEKMLSHMSFYDTLTSFYNRNRFISDLEVLADEKISLGIVYLDVNGLKEVNDKLGHACGDKILAETADKIRSVFDKADCYRVGGDEFVVIDKKVTEEAFEEKVDSLKKSFRWDNRCKAAIGIEWTSEARNIKEIVANADARMYEDKKEFYRKNQGASHYRHRTDEVLQLADPDVLKEEIGRQQFVVYLQPKISSSDRIAVGAEALIRYQSRDGSLVLPGNFLPILEEAKSISLIDFYVFDFVCSKIKDWMREGKKGVPVSVNFSRYSLVQPSFVERLKGICEKYGISPTCLEIEITESVQEVEGMDISALIIQLRREGFGVIIDDFGTEYANLALLSAVEFDVLKLDKSMVKDIVTNQKVQTIIQSIVAICRTMEIQLVAEGIEEEEQLEALRACGVELVQGYLFSQPIPIEEYEEKYL